MGNAKISRRGESNSPLAVFAAKKYSSAKRIAILYANTMSETVTLEFTGSKEAITSHHPPTKTPATIADRFYEMSLRTRLRDTERKAHEPFAALKNKQLALLERADDNSHKIRVITHELGASVITQIRLTNESLASLVAISRKRVQRLKALSERLTRDAALLDPRIAVLRRDLDKVKESLRVEKERK